MRACSARVYPSHLQDGHNLSASNGCYSDGPHCWRQEPQHISIRGRLEWVCTTANKAHKYWSSICPRKRHKRGCAQATGLRACTAACRINAGQGNDGGWVAGGAHTGGRGKPNRGPALAAAPPPLPPGVARPPALPGTPRFARQQVCSRPWLACMMPTCHQWQAGYLLPIHRSC